MKNNVAFKQHSLLLAFSIALAALIFTVIPALAQDPDFSTVDDPLDGEYELYTVDDLVIFQSVPRNNNTGTSGLNYILETGNETITSQSVLAADYPDCWLTSGRQPQQTRVGRFFALPYDVIVTLLPDGQHAGGPDCTAPEGDPNMALHIQSTQDTANTPTSFSLSAANTAVAMDDFNRDGFDDLFIMSDAEILVATAEDVNNRNGGMSFGPATALPSADYAARFEPVAGDFNGDGFVDIAWIDMQNTVRFATVCPAAVIDTICAGQEALAVLLNPQDSGAAGISVNTVSAGWGYPKINAALAAGHFASSQRDGLLVLDAEGSESDLTARWYEFEDDFTLTGGGPTDTYAYENTANPLMHIYATAAKLDWFGDNEQVVVGTDTGIVYCPQANGVGWTCRDSNSSVHVFQFKDDKITLYTTNDYVSIKGDVPLSPYWMMGIAVGHFGPLPQSPTPEDFNLQIATMLNDGTVNIYKFNSTTDFTPVLAYTAALDTGLALANLTPEDCVQEWPQDQSWYACPLANSWVVAGDLQGRSARLGPPSVVRVSQHMAPSVILGHPPMHADYILPDESTATVTETVNFSVVPSTYYSQYQTEVQSSNQSSHTDTTSHSYGFAESATEKVKFKVPFIVGLSFSFTQAWQQQTSRTTATNNYSYSSQSFDSSTNTGFGDQIWFSEYDFNMYYYPVLGQTVCPNDNPNCSPSEEQPLYVSYSGPSSINRNSVSGSRAEWYQPVHEPGQIFSYPISYAQLQERYDGLLPLSSTSPTGFYTDDSTNTQYANWSAGSGTNVTTDSVHTHSFKTSNSVTVGPPNLAKLTGAGAQISGSLAYNSSSASAGLQVTKTSLA